MINNIFDILKVSFLDPKSGAAKILRWQFQITTLIEFTLLALILSSILTQLHIVILPVEDEVTTPESSIGIIQFLDNPFANLILEATGLAITVLGVFLVGKLFGGIGSLQKTLILAVWLNYIMIVFQAVSLVITVIVPVLDYIFFPAGIILFFWLFSNFVTVLHGFKSALNVFFAAFLLILGCSVGITFLVLSG